MGTIGVVVPICGDIGYWRRVAQRAVDSCKAQTLLPAEILVSEGASVSAARNRGADRLGTDWLVFLDADDELDAGYIEAMAAASARAASEDFIFWPSTLGVVDGVEDDFPVLLMPKPNLLSGNHMVIGSMVRREVFVQAGRFRELPILEDWDLWIRVLRLGGRSVPVRDAIYRVHVRLNSRNTDLALHRTVYAQIQQRYSGQ